jgi:hypothetical protein
MPASSMPTYPPPTMAREAGRSGYRRASSLVSASSIPGTRGNSGREPVETTMCFAMMVLSPACTRSGDTKRASAWTTSTPRPSRMPSWSPAYARCAASRQAMSFVQSISGGAGAKPMRAAAPISRRAWAAA